MPPLLGQYASATGMDGNMAGNGTDRSQAPDPQAQVGELRQASEAFRSFLAARPSLQPLAKKFDALIRETLVALADQSPKTTPSSDQLPG